MEEMQLQRRMAEIEEARKASLENARAQVKIIEASLNTLFGPGNYAITPDGTINHEKGDLELDQSELGVLRESQEQLTALYEVLNKNI